MVVFPAKELDDVNGTHIHLRPIMSTIGKLGVLTTFKCPYNYFYLFTVKILKVYDSEPSSIRKGIYIRGQSWRRMVWSTHFVYKARTDSNNSRDAAKETAPKSLKFPTPNSLPPQYPYTTPVPPVLLPSLSRFYIETTGPSRERTPLLPLNPSRSEG